MAVGETHSEQASGAGIAATHADAHGWRGRIHAPDRHADAEQHAEAGYRRIHAHAETDVHTGSDVHVHTIAVDARQLAGRLEHRRARGNRPEAFRWSHDHQAGHGRQRIGYQG